MRCALLVAAGAVALLTGCGQSADTPANNAAVNSSPVFPVTDDNPAAVPPAPASKQEALKLMHDRGENMERIGKAVKAVGRELKAGGPDLAAIRSSAATIAALAPKVPSWFPTGTGPEVGKTKAKPGIWQKPADFAAKAKAFQDAALAFDATAKAGDMAAIKASFGDLGKTCKACHESYRAEKH